MASTALGAIARFDKGTMVNILGIETSCDDTAVSIVNDGSAILSNVIAAQTEMHQKYGGIIPEIASREHLMSIMPTVNLALEKANITAKDIDAVAVTHGPGLAGSLLVGLNTAKGLALAWDKTLIGINHLEGHIYSAWLEDVHPEKEFGFPIVCLIASGGHTDLVVMFEHMSYKVIGRTRDDAAGEAFDKVARVLGLGFPGGPEIQAQAEKSEGNIPPFPRPKIKNSVDFSFSGLKTAVVRRAEQEGFYPWKANFEPTQIQVREFAGAFQNAVVDCLIRNVNQAVGEWGAKGIILGGGVAANSELRKRMALEASVGVIVPRPGLCTDNGAMIAAAGYRHYGNDTLTAWELDAIPNLSL
jgi:N6-L-threonylcarbamoyladenine synthase